MPHRPLAAVLKMRQLAVEDARRAVRNCILAEAAAEEAVTTSEAAIAPEIAAALNWAAEDADVEAFALWLPEAQRRAQNAQARLEVAQQETARARAQLSPMRVQARLLLKQSIRKMTL
jgi:hypothetical protein